MTRARKRCPNCEAWSDRVYRCTECGHDLTDATTEVVRS